MRASCIYNLFVLSGERFSKPALEFSSFEIIQFRSSDWLEFSSNRELVSNLVYKDTFE